MQNRKPQDSQVQQWYLQEQLKNDPKSGEYLPGIDPQTSSEESGIPGEDEQSVEKRDI